jgi:GNAT superfamily N-acetyltransferase
MPMSQSTSVTTTSTPLVSELSLPIGPCWIALDDRPEPLGVGLGPVAVLPEAQRRGVGAHLINEGLQRCRILGYA